MNKPYIAAILAITRLAFSSAIAHTPPVSTHKIGRRNSQADFKEETKRCDAFSAGASGVCLVVAKNTEKFETSETHTQCRPHRISACAINIAGNRDDYRPERDSQCNLTKKCIVCTQPGSAAQLNCYAEFY